MVSKLSVAAALVILGAGLPTSHAQTYPDRVVRFVVPFTSGSPVDVLARVVSQELSARLGQTIIVDNRPGAGTTIGAKAVAAATADGYTLLIAGQSIVYSPMLYPNLGFDPLKSFVPVATLVEWSQLLVVAPSVPVKNVEELVAYAKANPGKLSLGYGIGTTPHIIGEMFKVVTKADINSVPYRGGAQAVTDLLGGRIHMNIGTTATLLPWIRQGKLRALAFSGMKRSSDLPEVPTLLESGFAQLAFEPTWQGVLAPAGTPTAVINKLNAAIRDSFSSPQVEASLSKLGFEKKLTSPQEFAAFLAAEAQRWPPIIRASGVKAE